MAYTAEKSRFDFRQKQRIFFFQSVETIAEAHSVSYSIGTSALYPGVKVTGA
jgi:hypothetical protein